MLSKQVCSRSSSRLRLAPLRPLSTLRLPRRARRPPVRGLRGPWTACGLKLLGAPLIRPHSGQTWGCQRWLDSEFDVLATMVVVGGGVRRVLFICLVTRDCCPLRLSRCRAHVGFFMFPGFTCLSISTDNNLEVEWKSAREVSKET